MFVDITAMDDHYFRRLDVNTNKIQRSERTRTEYAILDSEMSDSSVVPDDEWITIEKCVNKVVK